MFDARRGWKVTSWSVIDKESGKFCPAEDLPCYERAWCWWWKGLQEVVIHLHFDLMEAGQISILCLKTFNTLPASPLSLMVNSQKGKHLHFRLFSSDASNVTLDFSWSLLCMIISSRLQYQQMISMFYKNAGSIKEQQFYYCRHYRVCCCALCFCVLVPYRRWYPSCYHAAHGAGSRRWQEMF